MGKTRDLFKKMRDSNGIFHAKMCTIKMTGEEHTICCHFMAKDTHGLKVRGWKKILHVNGNSKKSGVAILLLDKIDFKTKSMKKDKDTV